MTRWVPGLVVAALLCGCPKSSEETPEADAPPVRHVVSDDVLARPPEVSAAMVKYVLISWAEIRQNHPELPRNPRAEGRTKPQAETIALDVLDRARHGEDFNQLMAKYSEDSGSARTGGAINVTPDGVLEPSFQALSLRLHVDEVGICQTAYGLHVIKRVR